MCSRFSTTCNIYSISSKYNNSNHHHRSPHKRLHSRLHNSRLHSRPRVPRHHTCRPNRTVSRDHAHLEPKWRVTESRAHQGTTDRHHLLPRAPFPLDRIIGSVSAGPKVNGGLPLLEPDLPSLDHPHCPQSLHSVRHLHTVPADRERQCNQDHLVRCPHQAHPELGSHRPSLGLWRICLQCLALALGRSTWVRSESKHSQNWTRL
mmetsp:Transcript_17117/g.46390  ORF Transcript_17117/g.46390 Transcript_17117/m.46390 type:complete len:205 (+) Transcript_17117:133-747(+)